MSTPKYLQNHHHSIRVACWLAAVILTAASTTPTAAQAETAITTQALADHGAFLAYAPAPIQRAGLCLVDTGVNLNPDTQTAVVDRVAIDNSTSNDVSPESHGTLLAMLAAAPPNNWGMIGTAPNSIQIVSVRIPQTGQSTFPFSSYAAGITACLLMRQQYDVRVINLSLGSSELPSSEDYEAVGNAIERAHNYGVAVVAAAGNDDGGPVGYPAAYPGVLSVGASDTQSGGLCSFSNRGPGLAMLAPGCDLDAADPMSGTPDYNYHQGTSEASAIAASALDALDAYYPQLTPKQAEEDLTSADHGTLDIAQTFRDAGLQQIVSEGEAAKPPSQPPANSNPTGPAPPSPSTGPTPAPTIMATSKPTMLLAPFPAPRARLRRRKGRLAIMLQERPSEAQIEIRYLTYREHIHRFSVTRTLTTTMSTILAPQGQHSEIVLRYVDPHEPWRASLSTTLRIPGTVAAGKSQRDQ